MADQRVPAQDREYGRLLAYIGEDRIVYWVPRDDYTGKTVWFEKRGDRYVETRRQT